MLSKMFICSSVTLSSYFCPKLGATTLTQEEMVLKSSNFPCPRPSQTHLHVGALPMVVAVAALIQVLPYPYSLIGESVLIPYSNSSKYATTISFRLDCNCSMTWLDYYEDKHGHHLVIPDLTKARKKCWNMREEINPDVKAHIALTEHDYVCPCLENNSSPK